MKKGCLGFLLIFCICSVRAAINISENSATRLSFTFDLGDYSISTVRSQTHYHSKLEFRGANTEIFHEKEHFPALALLAGVPKSGKITLHINPQEVKKIHLDHPMPISESEKGRNEIRGPQFVNPWVSVVTYMRFQNLRVGRFFLKPFLYDRTSQTLSVLIKGSVTIEFPKETPRRISSHITNSDYYQMLDAMLLNFTIAKDWIDSPRPKKGSLSSTSIPRRSQDMLKFTIGDGTKDFNEATTHENGIIKIKAADIGSLLPSRVSIQDISLRASLKNPLDFVVPPIDTIPKGYIDIPLLPFDLNNDGLFNGNDYFLTYLSGVSDWFFDSLQKTFTFQLNPYDNFRHFWVLIKGDSKKIPLYSCTDLPVQTIHTTTQYLRYKKSSELRWTERDKPYGGLEWIWKKLQYGDSLSFLATPPHPLIQAPGYMRVSGNRIGLFGPDTSLRVFRGPVLLTEPLQWTPFTNWNDSMVSIQFFPSDKEQFFQVQHVDLKYSQTLDMALKNTLRMYSPPDSGVVVSYVLTNLPSERFVVCRFSNDEEGLQLVVDTTLPGGTFSWVDTAGIGIQYFFSRESAFLIPKSMQPVRASSRYRDEITLPRIENNHADYLVITPSAFKTQAARLIDHKKKSGKFTLPKLIDVETIFKDFSHGNRDPGAIRNFLLYAQNFWTTKPEYVLLFGNGNYDYRNLKTKETNYIPTVQTDNFCLEDFFSILNPGEHALNENSAPDIYLGRINCNSITEASNAVTKIIDMEGPGADFGPWRNRLLLISDDDMQGTGTDPIDHYSGNEHIMDSVLHVRSAIEIRKVMLFEYEWNEVYEKPEASRALIDELNRGVSCVNYFGHGSDIALADEYILEFDKLNYLRNKNRYPTFNSFSCSVGRFDQPDKNCLSGALVKLPNAGAIAAISSARIAYASPNTEMAKVFYRYLYNKTHSWKLGQAYQATKSVDNGNLKRYVLLGDPSIQHMAITDSIELTITDVNGSPLLVSDSLGMETMQAYQTILVKGKAVGKSSTATFFNTEHDSVQIMLSNPIQKSVKRKDGGTHTDPVYKMPGTLVFIGGRKFSGGTFEQKIIIPRKVDFRNPGVSLTAYAWNGTHFATGSRIDLVFEGSQAKNVNDKDGPKIAVRPLYDVDSLWNTSVTFTDKISSFLPLDIEISVWDESGIDVRGLGPDEGLTVQIEKVINKENINQKFKFEEGEYTKGKALYHFNDNQMKPGRYTMTLGAQDLVGNVSSIDLTLEILSNDDFSLGHVFTHPNPVRMGRSTKFYFYHANTTMLLGHHGGVDATIKIYTLSGKLIRVFSPAKNGQVWDLTDQRGHQLSPNIYLYRVFVAMKNTDMSGNKREVKSPVKKLVIHPPR